MKKCWIVFEDDLHLNSTKVSRVFLKKDKAENYLQDKIDTCRRDDDGLVWTILESELDEELDDEQLVDKYEDYVPELNDLVQLSDLAYKYINIADIGDSVIGTVSRTRIINSITTNSNDCCEMYVEVMWNNKLNGQYPMSFLKKYSK